jgi:urease beta subunit
MTWATWSNNAPANRLTKLRVVNGGERSIQAGDCVHTSQGAVPLIEDMVRTQAYTGTQLALE